MNKKTSIKKFMIDWAAVFVLAASFIIFTIVRGKSFLTGTNMINVLRSMSINTVFGIAATVTMAAGGFDIALGTLGTIAAYAFVSSYLWFGLPVGVSIVVSIITSLIMYQLTMALIIGARIPDMLATVGLMFVHQGLGLWYVGGGAVSTGMRTSWGAAPARTQLSNNFLSIGRAPWIIIIMLACVFIAYVFLNHTKHGRYLYAIGGNKQAAELSGINVKKYRYLAGMITAVFIAIGGILVASRGSSAQVGAADNYLMPALAAVFIGQTVGGAQKPNAFGTMIGALLVATLENGLTIMAVPFYILPAVKGAILVLALVAAYAPRQKA